MNFPQTPQDILAVIRQVERNKKAGEIEQLIPGEIDLCIWLEPNASAVSSDPPARLYVGLRNLSPFHRRVSFDLTTQKKVVGLRGTVRGTIEVPPLRTKDGRANWDFCEAYAVQPGQKDDCVCLGRSKAAGDEYEEELRLPVETA